MFSAYLILEPTYYERPYEGDLITPGCRLAFYRSDGKKNELMRYFVAAEYPARFYSGFPYWCHIYDWNTPRSYILPSAPSTTEVEALGFNGYWTDINQNGWPEIAVYYYYCPNACWEPGPNAIHFYEIGPDHQVTDITESLPGVMEYFNLAYDTDPPAFFVFDPALQYYPKWGIIRTWWIYQWDDEKNMLVNVSSNYPEFYETEMEEALKDLDSALAQNFFKEEYFLAPLFIYEKPGRSEEAYAIFMEYSDLTHWESRSEDEKCWLQVARATATESYTKGEQFRFPEARLNGWGDYSWGVRDDLERLPVGVYDVSYCEQYRESP